MRMAEEGKTKTAFTSPIGLYHFTVKPFGLSVAPATFQHMMDTVFRWTEEYARVYLDNMIIFSLNWESHLQHIKQIFQWLRGAGLTVKLKKCTHGKKECSYLGHKIKRGGIRPEDTKIIIANK